jgi:hypothetical protein
MKKTFCLLSICLFFISCGPTAPVIPSDPEGTMTVNLSTTVDYGLFVGLADKPLSSMPYVIICFSMTNTLNTHFNITVCESLIYPSGANFYNTGGEVVDMGTCDGLGDVTTKPSSGYSSVSSIQLNHGYVIRFRKSYDQTDITLPYTYARFYAVNWLTSTTGGIIGVTIKVQLPF